MSDLKRNWYALLISIIKNKSCEQALISMGTKTDRAENITYANQGNEKEIVEIITNMCKEGATQEEVADKLGTGRNTLYYWIRKVGFRGYTDLQRQLGVEK